MSGKTLPWVEKYRPKNLESVILNDILEVKLSTYSTSNMPNLLLYGPPGTGKTTTALAIVSKVLKNKENFIELNASDNRGINMISEFIQSFCKSKGNEGIKIIILDEADNITQKAQERLINFMENYSFIRFIFTCNDQTQIIEPLQSRCNLIKYQKPTSTELEKILLNVALSEGVVLNKDIIPDLLLYSDYDIRKSINNFEALCSLNDKVGTKEIKSYFNKPSLYSIIKLVHELVNKVDLDKSIENTLNMINSGLNILDLIVSIINIFQNTDDYTNYFKLFPISHNEAVKILEVSHSAYYKCIQTSETKLQLVSFVCEIFEINA